MRVRIPLKLKLAFAASVLVALTVGAVGLVLHDQLEEDTLRVFNAQQEALAVNLARDLSDKLELQLRVLEQAASLTDETDLATPQTRRVFLQRMGSLRSTFDGVAIIATDGEIVLADPPLPAGQHINVSDRAYFRQAVQGGASAISEPLLSRTQRGPAVFMAKAVRSTRGEVIAVLSAGLNLQRPNILGRMNETPIGATGHVEVFSSGLQGVFVVHPRSEFLLRPVSQGEARPDSLAATAALRTVPWELRVVLPAWEARAPAVEAQRRLRDVVAVLGLAAALFAWISAYFMLLPLTVLHNAIRELRASPDARVALDTSSNDERGDLAREFEHLLHDLRERDEELAAVSAASPIGLFRASAAGELTWVNDEFLRIHGLEREEAARGWLTLLAPERREAAWSAWLQSMQSEAPLKLQLRVQRRDGRDRTLSIRTAPVYQRGQLSGHVGAVTDITERVEGERAQRILTAILDATTDYVVLTDDKGRINYLNPAARQALDIAPQADVSRRSFMEFNTPETNALFESTILPAVRARSVWLGETTVYAAGQREVPVSHLVIAHRDRKGRIERFSAVMRDISAQRAAQMESLRQSATFQSIAESIPSLVAVVGADQRYRFINTSFEQWHGIARAVAVGKTVAEVLGPRQYATALPWIERALAGETVHSEREYEGQGAHRNLAVTYIPLRLADGVLDGFVGVAMDVTQQRQKEAHLQRLAERDPLTSLLNRAGFEAYLDHRIALGEGAALALMYIDLDHFKPVNDQYGHPMGDLLLQHFAGRLRHIVRPSDAVARLGGDEFAIALVGVKEPAHLAGVAQKVLQAAHQPFEIEGTTLRIGASVGSALGVEEGQGWKSLVARADAQLYKAKSQGRGRHSAAV